MPLYLRLKIKKKGVLKRMVSKEMENVFKLLAENRARIIKKRVEESRKGMEEFISIIKLPKDVKIEYVDAGGVPAAWITTPGIINHHVVLYLHGGGYMQGSIKTHQDLTSRISRVAKARALSIDYRLAPEHKFPAALEDVVKAYQWLINDEGILPDNIIIAGDSAGGGLTLATLVKLRDIGIPLPAAAVSLSPWTDLSLTGESCRKNMKIDPLNKLYDAQLFADLYLGTEDPQNPYASPLYADLKGLPPILIQVGSTEILLDDSVRFAERAKEAGIEIELDIWEDMPHVFQTTALFTPEGKQGIEKIGEFIKKFFK